VNKKDSEHPSTQELTEQPTKQAHTSWAPGALLCIAACLLGGALGCLLDSVISPVFPFPALPEVGLSPKPELVKQHSDAQYAFRCNNGAVSFAVIGLCLGAAFGFGSTRIRRSLSAIAGGLIGGLAGAASGYAAGVFVAKSFVDSTQHSLLESTGIHALVWVSIATGIAFSVGLIQSDRTSALKAAFVGGIAGLMASLFHNIVSSVAFPSSNPAILIPESLVERFVWIVGCTVVLGAGISFGLRPDTRRKLASNPQSTAVIAAKDA
jgi:hypothetical protein